MSFGVTKALNETQQRGLSDVISLMKTHGLTPGDVKTAYKNTQKNETDKNSEPRASRHETLMRLFLYLGGTLIFAGLGVFIETMWDSLNSFQRVLITLGPGFVAFLIGLACAVDTRFARGATPAFIVAFLLQPTGLFIWLNEYFSGGDPALGSLFVFGLLSIQQGLAFVKLRSSSLLLFTLLFITGAAASITEYADINRGLSSLMLGFFLFFITVDLLRRTHFQELTPFLFIISTGLFYAGLYYYIGMTVFDPLILSVILIMLAYAVIRESKTLYVLSVLYMASYFLGGPGGGWGGGWGWRNELAALFTGASLVLTGYWIARANIISLYPVWMFVGTGFALSGAYGLLNNTMLGALFAGVAALAIYGALLLRSRAVLAASVISLISFIVSFSARHFANTVGWPILLMVLGVMVLMAGFMFARLAGRIKNATPV